MYTYYNFVIYFILLFLMITKKKVNRFLIFIDTRWHEIKKKKKKSRLEEKKRHAASVDDDFGRRRLRVMSTIARRSRVRADYAQR